MIYKTIQHAEDPDFYEALALYREAFPPEEQQSPKSLQKRITALQGQFLVAKEDERVKALAVLSDLSDGTFTLLEYFAVHRECRGTGLGSAFLNHLIQITKEKKQSLVAEVEDPTLGSNSAQRQRRMNFYGRNGFQRIGEIQSFVPALSGAESTAVLLLAHPLQKRESYQRDEIEQLILSIFGEIYQLEESNARVRKVISGIQQPCPLLNIH